MRRNKDVDLIDLIGNTVACPTTGCWLWLGSTSGSEKEGKTGRGYPRIKWRGFNIGVHRLVMILLGIKLGPNDQVDHKCHNRLCIRPKHLEKVTHKENTRRRDAWLRRMKREEFRCAA